MIAYLDSSFLLRAYLADEPGAGETEAVLAEGDIVRITGSWTRIEASGALVRAARAGRIEDARSALARLDRDLADDGLVAVLAEPQEQVGEIALRLARAQGMRAMDAWHLAVASLTLPAIAEPGEEQRFATHDREQAAVAEQQFGFAPL